MTDFNQTDITCSNVYLIDENLCAGNTINLLNYNVTSLSASIVTLQSYETQWYSLYQTLINSTQSWIAAANNVQTLSGNWVNFVSVVQNLSSFWGKQFSVVIPNMQDVAVWNNYTANQQNAFIVNWLSLNFPTKNFNIGQIITVTIYLYETVKFSLNFDRSLEEPCTPNCDGVSIGCQDDACGQPFFVQSNHHGGLAGYKNCDNLFNYCTQTVTGLLGDFQYQVGCIGDGGRTLEIGLNKIGYDTHVAQIINTDFINTGGGWGLL